ncbi:MAG: hypothetical protein JWQ08_1297 [Deinococcus sp.]|nr:hypothetical protein [Deinococcus sp.]
MSVLLTHSLALLGQKNGAQHAILLPKALTGQKLGVGCAHVKTESHSPTGVQIWGASLSPQQAQFLLLLGYFLVLVPELLQKLLFLYARQLMRFGRGGQVGQRHIEGRYRGAGQRRAFQRGQLFGQDMAG